MAFGPSLDVLSGLHCRDFLHLMARQLFSSVPKPAAGSRLLQLGLDEHNTLKVYHY